MATKKILKFGDKVTHTRHGKCIFEGYSYGMDGGETGFVLVPQKRSVCGASFLVEINQLKCGWVKKD